MRVIAGTLRGRILDSVPGRETRPTSDRVKEAMFSILGGYLAGGTVLDGFAGTGALGIEALSRGADRAVFVEKAPAALRVLRKNLAACRLEERSVVMPMDWSRALSRLASSLPRRDADLFRWVFLDPPYRLGGIPTYLEMLECYQLIAPDAVAVAETAADTELPERIGGWLRWKRARYGDTALTFYRKESFQ
ncbi:MAG: 16S rRNA (guanine(966)-N(2))-methyltransferase RsmD [Alicyclobacillaceae bacterium]|nr:16S rRNA (guanine(966)-N(2))-methyltransferase RsmD [Alicyclobacillaceae bacterium]